MNPNQPSHSPEPEPAQPPKKPSFDPCGGLDPVLVALSDVLPAKVFEHVDLT